MKDKRHIQSFNEHQENLNSELSKETSSSISDVRSSKTPEDRLEEYVDNILEDLDRVSKMEDINKIKQELGAIHNMIINDRHYVFNPERVGR